MKNVSIPMAAYGVEFVTSESKVSHKSPVHRVELEKRTIEQGLKYMDKQSREVLLKSANNVGSSFLAAALSEVADLLELVGSDNGEFTYHLHGISADTELNAETWRDFGKGFQETVKASGNRSFAQVKTTLKTLADGKETITLPHEFLDADNNLIGLRVLREMAGAINKRKAQEKAAHEPEIAVSALSSQLTTIGSSSPDVVAVGRDTVTSEQGLVAFKLALGSLGKARIVELLSQINE